MPRRISPNPFVVGIPVPPEKFIGRESIIQTAFDQIYHLSHLAVWGGLGTGKTSLLVKLADPKTWIDNTPNHSSAVIVLVNCEQIEPFTPSGFWKQVFRLLEVKLHNEPRIKEQVQTLLAEGRTSKDSLSQILGELRRKQKFLVLLIDDYDMALFTHEEYSDENMQQFLSECRNLAVFSVDGTRNISIIVTSEKRLNDIRPSTNTHKSPWYNQYLFQHLKPFNNNEFKQLVEPELLKPFNQKITQELQEALREIVGCHPTLLQIACHLLYQKLRNENLPTEEAIEAFIQTFTSELENATKPFFDSIWRQCNINEKNLLMLIALSKLRGRLHPSKRYDLKDVDLIFTQHEKILTNLSDEKQVIQRLSENGNYIFTSSLMEKWVIQEIWNCDDDSLQERQKAFLNIMSHQQIQKVKDAINWVIENQKEVRSSLEFVYPIVERIVRFFIGFI